MTDLLKKYNIPGPRYTSYPTVPYWDTTPTEDIWKEKVRLSYQENKTHGLSLYLHMPFCEHLCTYCGCNKAITRNHSHEEPYIEALLKEWQMYLELLGEKPLIKEIHLGGGTPTFFSAKNLKHVLTSIIATAELNDTPELSIEVHPSYTTEEQLATLREIGFNRISIGVQDFDIKVQEAISRIQPFEEVELTNNTARKLGFESVNFDLIYGLPFQTEKSIIETFEQVKTLRPDRIAFYSYAHVPWVKGAKAQRLFTEEDLPIGEEKRKLYELGRELLHNEGYVEIGMDHFSLEEDSLYKAFKTNKLHRNFMGYTTTDTKLLVGLGASSISDSWSAYIQNEKHWKKYIDIINEGNFPIIRGHVLTEEDLFIKEQILDLMCHFQTQLTDKQIHDIIPALKEPFNDKLIVKKDNRLVVTEKGKGFVRNICMAFDKRLLEKQPQTQIFSSTI